MSVSGDGYYKGGALVTVDVLRLRSLRASIVMSIYKNVQPLTGNGDVCKGVGQKPNTNKVNVAKGRHLLSPAKHGDIYSYFILSFFLFFLSFDNSTRTQLSNSCITSKIEKYDKLVTY